MADNLKFDFSPDKHEELIKLCQQETDRDIIAGARLGYYDEYDRYIIPQEIRQELLDMPKIITTKSFDEQGTEILDLYSPIPLFDGIKFKLTIGEKESVLYLVEEVFEEEIKVVSVYEEMLDVIPLSIENRLPNEVIFANYHIIDGDEDDAKELVFDIENILIRKIYLTLLTRQMNEIDWLETEDTFNQIMELLKDGGDYGMEVLATFAEEMKGNQDVYEITSQKQYQKKVTNILMACIEKVSTKERLSDSQNQELYRKIKKLRNKELSKHLFTMNSKIDVNKLLEEAKQVQHNFVFKENAKNEKIREEFYTSPDILTIPQSKDKENEKDGENKAVLKSKDPSADGAKKDEKNSSKKTILPVLKQNKANKNERNQTEEPKTKEDKIRAILEKSQQNKENKKVLPANNAQKNKTNPPPKIYRAPSSKEKTQSKPKPKTGSKTKGAGKTKKPTKPTRPKIKTSGGSSKPKVNKPKPKPKNQNKGPAKFSSKPPAKSKPKGKGPTRAEYMISSLRREGRYVKNGGSMIKGKGRSVHKGMPPRSVNFGQGPHPHPGMNPSHMGPGGRGNPANSMKGPSRDPSRTAPSSELRVYKAMATVSSANINTSEHSSKTTTTTNAVVIKKQDGRVKGVSSTTRIVSQTFTERVVTQRTTDMTM